MTNQEFYNFSVRNIINQGGPSIGETSDGAITCLYRDFVRNRKCVIGHVILDYQYIPEMEQKSFEHTLFSNCKFGEDRIFLRSLQEIHDDCARTYKCGWKIVSDEKFFLNWIPKMIAFAKNNYLDYSVFQEFVGDKSIGQYFESSI